MKLLKPKPQSWEGDVIGGRGLGGGLEVKSMGLDMIKIHCIHV